MPKNIAYIAGREYWTPCYVSIYSLLKNNQNLDFNIFVLCDEKNKKFDNNIEFLRNVHSDFSLKIIQVDEDKLEKLPLTERGGTPYHTYHVYYKLIVSNALPLENDNVLVMDSDIIIDGSLSSLFDIDLSGYIAAATPEFRNKAFSRSLSVDSQYINTGVLYINLNEWNANNITSKCFDYLLSDEYSKLADMGFYQLHEQDALNKVLNESDKIEYISPIYNAYQDWQEILSEMNLDPIVIHFNGSPKPWDYLSTWTNDDIWWKYFEETPYERSEMQKITWRMIIHKKLRPGWDLLRKCARRFMT